MAEHSMYLSYMYMFNGCECRRQAAIKKKSLKKILIHIFIAIFGFCMKKTLKWVQTSLVLVK